MGSIWMFIRTIISLHYVFTQKELNLQQRRCLELLKNYDMGVLYHLDKYNVVKDVHRLARLGVRIEDSRIGCVVVRHNSESSLVFELKSKKHFDQALMELKELVLSKLNESFSLGRWCLEVPRKVIVFPI